MKVKTIIYSDVNTLTPEKLEENKIFNENNFSIIRILQYDVYNNKNDWFNILCKNIEKIIKEGIIQNIYMSHNNEYNVLQKL